MTPKPTYRDDALGRKTDGIIARRAALLAQRHCVKCGAPMGAGARCTGNGRHVWERR